MQLVIPSIIIKKLAQFFQKKTNGFVEAKYFINLYSLW